MAYDKHTWTCDEPITVERLNHIEDGIANAGGGDCGFECEEGMVTLTEESVTTTMDGNFNMGTLSYSQLIDAESIKVTFNGTVYECEKIVDTYGGISYGAPYDNSTDNYDWSEYPFAIDTSAEYGNHITTQTAGTYTVKIEGMQEVVTTTPCFEKAVQAVVLQKGLSPLILTQSGSPVQLDRTFGEISNAYLNGRAVLLDPQYNTKHYYSMVSLAITDTTNPQSGGRIVFGGETTQAFSASSESDYPVLETT